MSGDVLRQQRRLSLQKVGVLKLEDYRAAAIKVFWRYMQVMRALQSTYWLEPAGQFV